ncbi:hypothetical protein MSAN_01577800 [Mycena sanguinolenta]|uniref:C3H1-type domain-containing protein n=1 Tax=Mycena sanguinolenta TaxID=230812 RepID=A0A8H6Y470_9AGAR|nr:hypothetical protein MSAN_01577800 [Mycena sanguinolenta]
MPSADRDASPDDREKDEGRGGSKKSSASKTKDLSHVPCKFYKVGSCTAGSSCPFSHSLVEPGGQKDVCAWFVKGNCKFGHKCALAHVLPGQTMAMDRKNKKAAQIAANGAKNSGEQKGGGRPRREQARGREQRTECACAKSACGRRYPPRPLPRRSRTPTLRPLACSTRATSSRQPLRGTSPPSPTVTKPPSSPTLPVSAPRRPSVSSPAKDFGPIGSPPSSATSPSSRMHSGTPPTQANGFLSTSPFSAPGSKPPFLGYGDGGRVAASLGSGMAMGGGLAGWNNANANGVSSSPLRGSLLSAGRMNGRANGDYDISLEYEELGAGIKAQRRKPTLEDSEDLEEFLPSSLTDLLTPEERMRRMSRTNSGQSPGFESSSPHRHGLGVPLAHNAAPGGGGGHRYSRSVPAPSLLGGDLKSIWANNDGPAPQASGLPGSPMGIGMGNPSSYSSASGFGGRGDLDAGAPSSSFAERTALSPSNASAAFLPGIHHYIAQNKQQAARSTSNPTTNNGANGGAGGLFASNAAAQQGPPGIAHYLQSGPSGVHKAINNAPSPYVRPNPFDLTQQPALHGHGNPIGMGMQGAGVPGAGDTHILSPNARALQAHAPGQSLPQGLAAGYSRMHALPLPPGVGSPSPAAFNAAGTPASPPGAGGYNPSRDWATMSTGSVSGSPGFMSFMKPPTATPVAAASPGAGTGAGYRCGRCGRHERGCATKRRREPAADGRARRDVLAAVVLCRDAREWGADGGGGADAAQPERGREVAGRRADEPAWWAAGQRRGGRGRRAVQA